MDHVRIILSAVLQNDEGFLGEVRRNLTEDSVSDPNLRSVYRFICRYMDACGKIPSEEVLQDSFRSADPGKLALLTENFRVLLSLDKTVEEGRWSLDRLIDIRTETATAKALLDASQILRDGKYDEQGNLVQGHLEARKAVIQSVHEIETSVGYADAPEGDVREEGASFLADYDRRENDRILGNATGCYFGIGALDQCLGGLQPGELDIIAGSSSSGKTAVVTQLAWYTAIMQGRNVVIFTTETLRSQVHRRLVARHSCIPEFNLPQGLNTRDLKYGTLSPQERALLPSVVHDLEHNGEYGKLHVAQIPRGATIADLEVRLSQLERRFKVDLVVMDYLALLSGSRKHYSEREELSSIVKDAKAVAVTHANGRGVPFVSPWQLNRSGQSAANASGRVEMDAVAATAEAVNTADVIVTLMPAGNVDDRIRPVFFQALKVRDGETNSRIDATGDYATCRFYDGGSTAALEALITEESLAWT